MIRNARLLALCSPVNPTGTVFDADTLREICQLVVEENERRSGKDRPLYVLYDQVYWMLTAAGVDHVNPVALVPEIAPYTVAVDAISKAFASTGLRVGWAVGPADIIKPMNDIIGHVGAWAPRPEQVATAKFMGVLSLIVTIGVAALKFGIFVVLPIWLMWKVFSWIFRRGNGGSSSTTSSPPPTPATPSEPPPPHGDPLDGIDPA